MSATLSPLSSQSPRSRSFASSSSLPKSKSKPEPELRDSPTLPSSSSSLEIIGNGRSLLSRFQSLQKPYKAYPIIGWNTHVETIFAAFFRSRPKVAFRRECLRTKDDGAIALDWVAGDELRIPFDAPVLILLPGLTGGSDDT